MKSLLATLFITLLISGCLVGPDYKRPAAVVPTDYRGVSPEASKAEAASLGDQKWWEVFRDEQLQSLIRTALQQNYDVRIAATHILQAQAQLGIIRSNQYPSVSGGADQGAHHAAADAAAGPGKHYPGFETADVAGHSPEVIVFGEGIVSFTGTNVDEPRQVVGEFVDVQRAGMPIGFGEVGL